MAMSPELVAQFETLGFVHLRAVFTPEEVRSLRSESEAALQEAHARQPFPPDPVGVRGEMGAHRGMQLMSDRTPLYASLGEDERLAAPARQMFGDDCPPQALHATMEGTGDLTQLPLVRLCGHHRHGAVLRRYVLAPVRPVASLALPAKPPACSRPHPLPSDMNIDSHEDLNGVKFYINLDAVTAATGALRLMPGSHREPMHSELSSWAAGEMLEDLPCHVCEAQPGDVIGYAQQLLVWYVPFRRSKI